MRKLSQINEGLWSKGIERSKSDNERIEDNINSNIKELNPIDIGLPFMFSDDYLIIEDNDKFTYDDLKKYETFIKQHGWRLPGYKEFKNNLFNEDNELLPGYKLEIKKEGTDYFAHLSKKENNNIVIFKLSSYLGDKFWTTSNMYIYIFHSITITEFQFWRSDCNCRLKIRLIKDK